MEDIFSHLDDLDIQHLDVIDAALSKHIVDLEEYLMYLDDLVYDGINVPDEEFELSESVLRTADEALDIIWAEIEEHEFYDEDGWTLEDDYEFDLWDDVEQVEADELEVAV